MNIPQHVIEAINKLKNSNYTEEACLRALLEDVKFYDYGYTLLSLYVNKLYKP